MELHSEANNRRKQLDAVLGSADLFWVEFERAQNGVHFVRQQFESAMQPGSESGEQLAQAQQQLHRVQAEHIPNCSSLVLQAREYGSQLCELLTPDEDHFVKQHLIMLDTHWNAVLNEFSRLDKNLLQAVYRVKLLHI